MTPELKRALLPLRLPRTLNLRDQRIMTAAWLPWRVFAAAVDGYLEAFFAVLIPPPNPRSEKNEMTKPLCIYHHGCLDGFAAAWAVRKHYGDGEVEFHPGIYGKAPPDVTGRVVILVDFSYKRDVLLQVCAQAACVLILDHHKSAAVDLLESAKARIKTLEGANAAYQRVIDFDQLQAQQETISVLKNEIKLIGEAINDPRVDLTMTMSEVITETRQKPVAVGLAYLYRVYMLIDAFPH